jgi:hypothetical protein
MYDTNWQRTLLIRGSYGSALGGFLVCLAALTAACGGGNGPLTLEKYFQELLSLNQIAEQQGADLEADLDAGLQDASDAESVIAYRAFFNETIPLARELASDLRDLDPPPEIEMAHNEFVADFEDLVEAFEAAVSDLDTVGTRGEVEQLITDRIASAAVAGREACLNLQEIAHDNGIGVDLECES